MRGHLSRKRPTNATMSGWMASWSKSLIGEPLERAVIDDRQDASKKPVAWVALLAIDSFTGFLDAGTRGQPFPTSAGGSGK